MRRFLAALLLLVAGGAFAQSSEIANPDPKTEARLKELAEELRCLVCQNQTIADSNAPLAVDLRQQIRGQIAQGRSDTQILDYMVERYGDFVLYRPPLRATTLLLWIGPFALVAVGAFIYVMVLRRRKAALAGSRELTPQRRAELEALLSDTAAPVQPPKNRSGRRSRS
jgi:cytochrome c-type biogenesis protein CcmH